MKGKAVRAAQCGKSSKVFKQAPPKREEVQHWPVRANGNGQDHQPAIPWVQPRRFPRVPTHAVGVAVEQRAYPRAALRLPLRLVRVAGQREPFAVTLLTKNISSCGVYFLSPRFLEPGTPVELEVGLVERPLGRGSVRMATAAHIVRAEPAETPGWHGLAASFDDITFHRDEHLPHRFQGA